MRAILLSFLFVTGVILNGIASSAYAESSSDAWIDKTIGILGKGRVLQSSAPVCNGEVGTVRVVANGTFENSCISGDPDGIRIARFYSDVAYLYAVAFPHDEQFYELRGSCELAGCAYASKTDTLVTYENIAPWQYGGVVYKNFKAQLTLAYDTSKASPYFRFTRPDTPSYAVWMGSYHPTVGALAISPNGKWALFEVKSYGIVRLDLQTMKTRRVIPQTGSYGYGYDPVYELAVSDDGKYVVATGRNVATLLVSVNDACGDSLVEGMAITYAPTIIPCRFASINNAALFPNTSYISFPRFDMTGERLGLTANYSNGTAERVIIGDQANLSSLGYLALGDSFTSGEGELSDTYYGQHSNEDPIRCHLSTRSYPYLIGLSWSMTTKSVACSGAQSGDVGGSPSYNGQGDSLLKIGTDQLDQLKASALENFRPGIIAQSNFVSEYQPKYVSLSVGGNDAGLVGKLTACVSPGTCKWAGEISKRKATANEIASVYTPIKNSIEKIKNLSPQSSLFIVGYPQVMSKESTARCDALTGTLLNTDERVFIWESIHYLNQVVKAAAISEGIPFIDVENSFEGHELCGSTDNSAMNSIRLGDDIAPLKFLSTFYILGAESFHPTPLGQNLVADAVLRTFPNAALVVKAACPQNCPSREVPAPSDYWGTSSNTAPIKRQLHALSIISDVVQTGTNLVISAKDSLFKPLSKVSIELHSEPVSIGEGTATSEGLFQQSVLLPDSVSAGYHTLHLIGTSWTNEPIDVYKTIAVINNKETQELASLPPDIISPDSHISSSSSANRSFSSTNPPFQSNNSLSAGVLSKNSQAEKTAHSSTPRKPHISQESLIFTMTLTIGGMLVALVLWIKHLQTSHNLRGG